MVEAFLWCALVFHSLLFVCVWFDVMRLTHEMRLNQRSEWRNAVVRAALKEADRAWGAGRL
jgi:hypothetical protein